MTINFNINHTNYLIRIFFINKKYLPSQNLIYIKFFNNKKILIHK